MGSEPQINSPRPLARQRSPWQEFDHISDFNGYPCTWHRRRVNDGELTACVANEPSGWHMSISFRNHRGDPTRYPNWDEIAHARYALLPDDCDFVMHLPPPAEYVAVHDTTFHLHEHPER